MTSSPLAALGPAPLDPILGVTEAFLADRNPLKVNLGVGLYYGDDGKVPVLDCVRRAEQKFVSDGKSRAYLPMEGLGSFNRATRNLLFGEDHAAVRDNRILTAQTLGGTGALRLGADFLRLVSPHAGVWLSDPSWENHRPIFEAAGFKVGSYPYYNPAARGIDIDAMIAALRRLAPGSIVVLHACCHNPTGLDPSPEQWRAIRAAVEETRLVPFLDLAYQGFADGLDADGMEARRFADECPLAVVSSSFSKSLSIYSERVGALSIVTAGADEAKRALGHVKQIVRANYSGPTSYGGCIASNVLTDPALRAQWEAELGEMRERIKTMRRQLVDKVRAIRADLDLNYVVEQRGMFSFSGLNQTQVAHLREKHSIYLLENGRVCIAALNARNIDHVAQGVADVMTT